jgi:hypothetical protein
MAYVKHRKQLHQSGVEMAAKCSEQFFRRYIRGERRPPKSFLISGQAVDAGVTYDLNQKIAAGELANEEDVKAATADYVEHFPYWHDIEREDDEIGKSDDQLRDQTKDKAVRLIEVHHEVIAPHIQPAAYEQGTADKVKHPFSVSLDRWLRKRATEVYEEATHYTGWLKRVRDAHARALNAAARTGFDFVGERDIVERFKDPAAFPSDKAGHNMFRVRDTKTSKKSPSADIADHSHQLSAYALASQVIEGRIPDALVLDYVIDLQHGVKAQSYTSTRDETDLDIYLARIEQTIVSITTGNFMPAPEGAWWCDVRYCGYYSDCKYVRGASRPRAAQLVEIKLEKS